MRELEYRTGSNKAGFAGKDTMREKANRMLGNEKTPVSNSVIESKSAKSKEKMLPYKKGGHAKDMECYAAGGVGKIRHKQATASGKPINKRGKHKF